MSSLTALYAARSQILAQIETVTASLTNNRRALANQQAQAAANDSVFIQINIDSLQRQIAQDIAELARLNAELADIDRQIAAAQIQDGPRQSAGETVAQGQRANDDRADTIAPSAPVDAAAAAVGVTNADQFPAVAPADAGTDAPTRSAVNLQGLPPLTAQPGAARQAIIAPNSPGQSYDVFEAGYPNDDGPNNRPSGQTGTASAGDDGIGNSNPTRAALNQLFSGRITPQANVLDQYASYTYSISIYLMSSNDYKSLINNPNALPKGAQLILQSGGAPVAGGALPTVDIQEAQQAADGNGAPLNVPELGRNPNFPLDYYLDDVRLTSYISGKGVGMAHNVFEVKFKVIEPNGITFLDNLYRATDQYIKLSGTPQVNYAAQQYLMVIRFYGYDKDGNLVMGQNQPVINPQTGAQTQTIVQKYIPFIFSGIKFRVANKMVEYECEAVGVPNSVATSPARGTIPYNVELTSQSLKDLLQGKQAFGSTGGRTESQDQGRVSRTQTNRIDFTETPTSSLPGSSLDAEFGGSGAGDGIAEALGRTPSTTIVTAGAAVTQNSAPPKVSAEGSKTLVTGLADALNSFQEMWVKKGTYTYPDKYFIELDPLLAEAKVVPPGSTNLRTTPMAPNENARDKLLERTQAVDSNAKKFSILAGQSVVQFLDQVVRNSTYIYDQQTKYYDPKTNELIENGKPANVTGWYRIGMQAVPQGADKYDPKRNDYAYNITYRVEVYGINDSRSDFFPSATYRGTHKVYNYWFTGENTQVLDYQQDFNYLYYIVQNARAPDRTRKTTNYREVPKFVAQPRSDQSDQMNEGTVSEPSAQLADYLYSPRDTHSVKLRILGDPSWIQQGDVRGGLQRSSQLYNAFLPDGTINYAGQEILFEVLWNKPQDYDLTTGVMDTGAKNYNANRLAGQPGQAVQTNVYRARSCISTFSRGRFEQEIEGNQIYFELPQAQQQQAEKNTRQVQTQNNTASGRLPLTNIPQANPGLLDLENGAGGEINYKPTSLATVLDQQKNAKSIFTPQTPRGANPAAPATSATQTVGVPDQSAAETNRLLGTARGPAVGFPSATLYLDDGSAVTVRSQSQINALRQGGFATAQAASAASSRLNLAQQAANNPTTAVRPQLIAKDS